MSAHTDKKIYVAGGTMELDYHNAVTNNTLATPSWVFDKVRVYIPSPAGNVGTAELDPSATNEDEHSYLVYHYDHLGSIQAITSYGEYSQDINTMFANDAVGRESLYSYNAWGQRRDPKDWNGFPWTQTATAPVTTWAWDNPATPRDTADEDDLIPRGFTGHEMMDPLGLINMNGRIYCAQFSLFCSADPLVQSPANHLSYNRYSYCMNSPLGYVDPSGFASKGDTSTGPDDKRDTQREQEEQSLIEQYGLFKAMAIMMGSSMGTMDTLYVSSSAGRAASANVVANVSEGTKPSASAENKTNAKAPRCGSGEKVDASKRYNQDDGESVYGEHTPSRARDNANVTAGGFADLQLTTDGLANIVDDADTFTIVGHGIKHSDSVSGVSRDKLVDLIITNQAYRSSVDCVMYVCFAGRGGSNSLAQYVADKTGLIVVAADGMVGQRSHGVYARLIPNTLRPDTSSLFDGVDWRVFTPSTVDLRSAQDVIDRQAEATIHNFVETLPLFTLIDQQQ